MAQKEEEKEINGYRINSKTSLWLSQEIYDCIGMAYIRQIISRGEKGIYDFIILISSKKGYFDYTYEMGERKAKGRVNIVVEAFKKALQSKEDFEKCLSVPKVRLNLSRMLRSSVRIFYKLNKDILKENEKEIWKNYRQRASENIGDIAGVIYKALALILRIKIELKIIDVKEKKYIVKTYESEIREKMKNTAHDSLNLHDKTIKLALKENCLYMIKENDEEVKHGDKLELIFDPTKQVMLNSEGHEKLMAKINSKEISVPKAIEHLFDTFNRFSLSNKLVRLVKLDDIEYNENNMQFTQVDAKDLKSYSQEYKKAEYFLPPELWNNKGENIKISRVYTYYVSIISLQIMLNLGSDLLMAMIASVEQTKVQEVHEKFISYISGCDTMESFKGLINRALEYDPNERCKISEAGSLFKQMLGTKGFKMRETAFVYDECVANIKDVSKEEIAIKNSPSKEKIFKLEIKIAKKEGKISLYKMVDSCLDIGIVDAKSLTPIKDELEFTIMTEPWTPFKYIEANLKHAKQIAGQLLKLKNQNIFIHPICDNSIVFDAKRHAKILPFCKDAIIIINAREEALNIEKVPNNEKVFTPPKLVAKRPYNINGVYAYRIGIFIISLLVGVGKSKEFAELIKKKATKSAKHYNVVLEEKINQLLTEFLPSSLKIVGIFTPVEKGKINEELIPEISNILSRFFLMPEKDRIRLEDACEQIDKLLTLLKEIKTHEKTKGK